MPPNLFDVEECYTLSALREVGVEAFEIYEPHQNDSPQCLLGDEWDEGEQVEVAGTRKSQQKTERQIERRIPLPQDLRATVHTGRLS